MKGHFRTIFVLALVILVTGLGSAQASKLSQAGLKASSAPSIAYPLERWKTDYISTYSSAGSDVSLAFDPDHGQAAWISYYNETYSSLWVAHFVGASGGNCGPETTWFCEQVDQAPSEQKGWSTSIDVFPDSRSPAHAQRLDGLPHGLDVPARQLDDFHRVQLIGSQRRDWSL